MPAIRGVFTKHPQTQEDGLWIWMNDGKGIVGRARSQWPTPKGNDTLASFGSTITANLQTLTGTAIIITVEVLSLSPVTLGLIEVTEGDMKQVTA